MVLELILGLSASSRSITGPFMPFGVGCTAFAYIRDEGSAEGLRLITRCVFFSVG